MAESESRTQQPDENNKKKNRSVFFGVLAGTPFVLYGKDYNPNNTNLGQKRQGTPKYKVRNKEGYPTGNGNAFEDVFARKMREEGNDVVQIGEYTNGVDFLINGTPVQCKYSSNPKNVFKKLFEDGIFRYPNQVIITNVENEEELRKLCNENPELFGGTVPEINPPEYAKCNSKEVYQQYRRGWGSIKNDTKDFFKDSGSRNTLFGGMLAVFLLTIGIEACKEYKKAIKSEPEESRVKCLGKAAVSSLKKHWGRALAASAAVGILILGANLSKRQHLRPA